MTSENGFVVRDECTKLDMENSCTIGIRYEKDIAVPYIIETGCPVGNIRDVFVNFPFEDIVTFEITCIMPKPKDNE